MSSSRPVSNSPSLSFSQLLRNSQSTTGGKSSNLRNSQSQTSVKSQSSSSNFSPSQSLSLGNSQSQTSTISQSSSSSFSPSQSLSLGNSQSQTSTISQSSNSSFSPSQSLSSTFSQSQTSSNWTSSLTFLETYGATVDARTGDNIVPEICVVCQDPMNGAVLRLNSCLHIIHRGCAAKMLHRQSVTSYFQCPICKNIQGIKIGNQPLGGKMLAQKSRSHLPGFAHCGTITITYDFDPGVQGLEHPNPGKPYGCQGFPRPAYLPDNAAGRQILLKLELAFDRRLIFTVGKSLTTGRDDVIIWNGIHHKTRKDVSNSLHGFPDADYFTKVLKELKDNGLS